MSQEDEVSSRRRLRARTAPAARRAGCRGSRRRGKGTQLGVAYVSNREQFGKLMAPFRPSGTRARTWTSRPARSLARGLGRAGRGSWTSADPDPPSRPRSPRWPTPRRRARTGDPVHGGIGFTWEYDLHRYFKRAQRIDAFGGHAAKQGEVVAAALLDPEMLVDLQGGRCRPESGSARVYADGCRPGGGRRDPRALEEAPKAEDNRSIEGLLATLSEDCVYTVYPEEVSEVAARARRRRALLHGAADRVPGTWSSSSCRTS